MHALLAACLFVVQPVEPPDPPDFDLIDKSTFLDPETACQLTLKVAMKKPPDRTPQMMVDGSFGGTIEGPAILRPGPHNIVLVADDFWDFSFDFEAKEKSKKQLALRLLPGISLWDHRVALDKWLFINADPENSSSRNRPSWKQEDGKLVLDGKPLPGAQAVAQLQQQNNGPVYLMRWEYRIVSGNISFGEFLGARDLPTSDRRWHTVIVASSRMQMWYRIDWARAVEISPRQAERGWIRIKYPMYSTGRIEFRNIMVDRTCTEARYSRATLSGGLQPKLEP